jgi:hypothetical protein
VLVVRRQAGRLVRQQGRAFCVAAARSSSRGVREGACIVSGELAVIEQQQGIDVDLWSGTLIFATQLANAVHDTEFVPAAMRGKPDVVAAAIMYGAEVGVTPMQALAGIHIVDGRPSPSAELMRAMILRAGHTFQIHEMSGTRVRVSGLRRGRPEAERVVIEWTLDMARAAGLLGRRNWQNYPRAMLTARATGDLARVLFADVVKGLGYVAEDASVDDLNALAGEAPERRPDTQKRALQRRQRRAAPVVEDEPGSAPVDEAAALPPVAPPRTTPDPPAAASPTRAGVDGGEPSAPAPVHSEREYDDDDNELTPESLQDEPPAPEAGPKLIGPSMMKALHAGLTRELGTVATREEKHELVGAILGHPIESTKDLTRAEATTVLGYMDRFATGDASWQLDIATGGVTVTDTREPPPEGGEPDA